MSEKAAFLLLILSSYCQVQGGGGVGQFVGYCCWPMSCYDLGLYILPCQYKLSVVWAWFLLLEQILPDAVVHNSHHWFGCWLLVALDFQLMMCGLIHFSLRNPTPSPSLYFFLSILVFLSLGFRILLYLLPAVKKKKKPNSLHFFIHISHTFPGFLFPENLFLFHQFSFLFYFIFLWVGCTLKVQNYSPTFSKRRSISVIWKKFSLSLLTLSGHLLHISHSESYIFYRSCWPI